MLVKNTHAIGVLWCLGEHATPTELKQPEGSPLSYKQAIPLG